VRRRPFNIDGWRLAAKRVLPRLAFDYIEGGVEDEVGIARNEAAFRAARVMPRYLVDVSARDTAASLFGTAYHAPFGIAPMGMTGLFRRDNDLVMAQAAKACGIPFVLSASGNADVSEALAVAPGHVWFQVYGTKDTGIVDDQARRAAEDGVEVLVLSVDVPVSGKRERNLRNGFTRPLRLNRSTTLNLLAHPRWSLDYLARGGLPVMKTYARHAPAASSANEVADFFAAQTPFPAQTWRDLERLRRVWPGRLLVKGILHPEDAVAAERAGADGVVVSNHGGRQLDRAASTLEMLPAIRAATGPGFTVILDSGIRRGADIAIALALGADFVLCGRAILYGAVAGGAEGAQSAIEILRGELVTFMGQVGCPTIAELRGLTVLPI
jgi:L-lactate dehydrogenase (cytochrome)/(S)-mandelate dehydrogenase